MGGDVIAETFPDNDLARKEYWLPFIEKKLKSDPNSILIGHSSGAIAAMRYAEKHRLIGTVLVGAYHSDLGFPKEKASGYFDEPWDWKAIKNNQQWVLQFASTDDPWIPIEEPRFIHEQLGSKYFEYDSMGHFGGDYYKPTFPELITALQEQMITPIL